ncbi:xanthine dehydrogenase family protein molybdopterin-binding subunit [Telluria aromaticivorans]|uniref:Xanthine dehydrogenase family protein molybdopterin-binding subunit n=1 Tax=Telluria aromaticivorans TaxID=2725995 RepID=A0A7Y2JXF2_9BURK|nr:molybdopterin cofactor-binding domain-containing protein [Telluria aromaticivorans]NNG22800.1 xanthine dehydrogenase family protein molybdopterin-binding subunit [Telluria aromaticivorans]
MTTAPPNRGRRRFLAANGGLVLSFALPAHAAAQGSKLPGSLDKTPWLDAWIRVGADNRVTVFTGKVELGQGIRTALLQVAAHELQIDPGRLVLVTADTDRTPDEGYTAGSHSMQDSGTALRHAAAQVRALLLGRAAARLAVPAAALVQTNSVFRAPDGRRVSFGELVADGEQHVRATGVLPPRQLGAPRYAGVTLPRVDIPGKLKGELAYVHDLRLPAMVHARVVRPPSQAARLLGVDTAQVARLPGVLEIVRDGRFLAVVADEEWRAVKAAAALARATRWEVPATLPVGQELASLVRSLPSQPQQVLARGAAGSAGQTLRATYTRPFQLHASLGPSCAVAQLEEGRYTVWTHSQGVFPLRAALAELLGAPEEAIRCVHMEGSGCYGHNGADDVAADAVLLARAFPGSPVRVQWMREEEHCWEPYGPAMVADVQATLDAGGRIVDWQYEVWSGSHNTRPGKAGNLLAATHLARPFAPPPPKPIPQPQGSGDRNAIPYYTLANARVTHRHQVAGLLRTSALRSLGAYCNVFAIESFMDELARAAKNDPVVFRLRHLQDARAIEVVKLAAAKFGWDGYKKTARRGRGFAFARYKNLAAYCAIALEVEVALDTGFVRITRAVAAVDCGEIVSPDGVRNQVEGGIIQSASWSLLEAVRFDASRVLTQDWASYPILRFDGVPDRVDVHLLDRPGQPYLGTGEAAQGPAAAALANAVADACGVRVRDLPLDRARMRGFAT